MGALSTLDFFKELTTRLRNCFKEKHRVVNPILAISETPESFLIDSIAQQNPQFIASWPEGTELDNQALVDAFIALVTAARELDPRLQKRFDQVVPRKAKEPIFWWRYFGHVHALLVRLAPTPRETEQELSSSLPEGRPLEVRRFPPAAKLISSGELERDLIERFLDECTEMLNKLETMVAMGKEARSLAESAGDPFERLQKHAMAVCMHYQLEYLEHLGAERIWACSKMHPDKMKERFPNDKILEKLQTFMQTCQVIPQRVAMRERTLPSDEASARRFPPARELSAPDELPNDKLIELVLALAVELRTEETSKMLVTAVAASADEQPQVRQRQLLELMDRWQREWFESKGYQHDAGVHLIFSIQEKYKPESSGGAPGSDKVLHALGRFKMAFQSAMNLAMIEITKPPVAPIEKRRFAPAASLQTEGELSREKILEFTRKAREMLFSAESLKLLRAAGSQSAGGKLSVQWQRELLEHVGVQMDHGCQMLGMVPHRYGSDKEVLEAFNGFASACQSSMEKALTAPVPGQEEAGSDATDLASKVKQVEIS